MNYTHFIGIDVAKSTLDFCMLSGREKIVTGHVSNNEKGLQTIKKQFAKIGIPPEKVLFCCENTGIYHHGLAVWAIQNGYALWIENAVAIKRSLGLQRGKNDQVDAYRIASYASRFEDQCRLWQPPRPVIQHLQRLMMLLQQLLKAQHQFKLTFGEMRPTMSKSEHRKLGNCTKRTTKGLADDIKALDQEINDCIAKDALLKRQVQLITSVDGAGLVTAVQLIIVTNEFKDVQSARSLACYAGIAPFEHTSGVSIRGRSSVCSFSK